MATRHPHAGRPSALSSMLEVRALFEMASLPYSLPMLMHAPQGDGHPVLLLPGFMGSEGSLIALELLPAQPRLRRADLGPGPQRRLPPRACLGHRAEDPLPAPRDRAQGQPGRLEPGRRVRALRRAPGQRMRAQRHHAGQPGHRRRLGQRGAAAAEGAVPADRAPDGLGRAFDAAARQDAARAQAAAGAGELPVFAQRRRRAAAGGHAGRRPAGCTRTSASGAATSAWASTRWCCRSWPTGSRSPRASGSLTSLRACWGWCTGR